MKEVWKDVKDFEGVYQVSNYGRVRSLDRYVNAFSDSKRLIKGQIVRPTVCTNGYLEYMLSKKRKRTIVLAHRLVASHFLENPEKLPEINHKDENPKNNIVTNLEWCTSKYNANYGTRNIRMMENRVFKKVKQFTTDGEFLKEWSSISDASRTLEIDLSSIIRVCKKRNVTAGGYKWEYSQ